MTKKQIIWGIVALVVVGGAAFYGGTVYASSQTPARNSTFGAGGTFARGTGTTTGAGFAARGGAAGGGTTGQILSQDSTGITVKLANGNTQIVLVSPATPISKQVSGSTSDLKVGANVVVTGTTNSDGSLTAQSIMIRPAGAQTSAPATQSPQTQ